MVAIQDWIAQFTDNPGAAQERVLKNGVHDEHSVPNDLEQASPIWAVNEEYRQGTADEIHRRRH